MSFFTQSLAMGGVPPSIARRGEIPLLSSLPANATFTGGPQYCEDNAETLKTAGADEAQFPGMRLVGTDWLPTASDGAKNHPTVNGVPQFYPNRQDSTAYILADIVNFAGVYWECTTAGTSDSSAPATRDGEDTSPSKSIGETITDGTIVWQYAGRYQDRVGYLSEEARTNSLLASELFSTWDMSSSPPSIVSETIDDPQGGSSATRVDFSTPSSRLFRSITSVALPNDAMSLYVRKVSGGATHIRFTTNNTSTWSTGVSYKILLTDNWVRVVNLINQLTSGSNAYVVIGSVDISGINDTDCNGEVDIFGVQLEKDTTFSTSYIKTEAATVTRPGTICELPSARYIRANDFAAQGYCIPEGAGQTGTIWSSYTDADNYTSLSISATEVILNKRLSGTSHTATVTYSHAADTPFQWQAFFDSTDGIGLRTREWSDLVWGAWEAWATDATATDIATPALQIGSIDDGAQFNGTIPYFQTKKTSDPKTWLENHTLY